MRKPYFVGTVTFFVVLLCAGIFWRPYSIRLNVRYPFPISRPLSAEKKIAELETRIAQRPSPLDLADLAHLYFHQGNRSGDRRYFEKAEQAAQRSLRELPRPNPAKHALAKLAEAQHDFARAIALAAEHYRESGAPGALATLVASHLALGDVAQAVRFAELAVERRADTSSFYLRALALAAQGREEEAMLDFDRALRAEEMGQLEDSVRTRVGWARFLARRGDLRNALALIREALRLEPDHGPALALQGEIYARQGKGHKAAESLMAAFRAEKQARYLVGYAKVKGTDPVATQIRDQAERLLRDDLSRHGFGHRLDLVELLLDRAKTIDLQEAVSLAQAELSVRKNAEAHYALARALFALGRWDEASLSVRNALASGTRERAVYELAHQIETARKRWERAKLYQRLATAAAPRLPQG